jgi:E3 ubiquitin-protein ligase HERC4
MFTFEEDSRTLWFAENPNPVKSTYHLVGLLCGLAIVNDQVFNLSFPLALCKKLLNEAPDLSDLKELSPLVWKSMQDILNYEHDDFEEVFYLTFDITRNICGDSKTIELKPKGTHIAVTQKNK